jgi:hypothetical protein
LGWWAAGCEAVFIVLWFINLFVFYPIAMLGGFAELQQTFFPIFGIFMMACGVAGGVLGLIALIRGERSWVVWLVMLPCAFALFFLLGEFIFPH